MSEDLFKFRIVTAKGEIVNEDVVFVKMPTQNEALGVLKSHSPMFAELEIGKVRISKEDGTKEYFFIPGGFAHVMPDEVLILTEFVEHAEDIDLRRAERDHHNAQKALKEGLDHIQKHRETVRLKRTAARMFVHSLQFSSK
jgi:F-type H+-transporting ATPase subunit epsilon